MSPKYQIVPQFSDKEYITLNPDTAKAIGIENMKIAYLRFGIKAYESKISISETISKDRIFISQNIIDFLRLPIFLNYELSLNKDEISIGPFIGMLVEKSEKALENNVDYLKSYLYSYEEIGGAILAFSIEGVDQVSQLITGYIFDPTTNSWINGIYSYPASIFKRIGLNKQLRNHFYSLLRGAIFNSYVFNKWESHQWLSSYDDIKSYLPRTSLYESLPDVRNFLAECNKIYIKPLYGSQGVGIIRIEETKDAFLLKYREDETEKEMCIETFSELNVFLKKNLKKGRFIIQKALTLISTEGSTIDFRLIMLKDGYGKWKDIGMVGRYGVKNSITSNISTGGSADLGEIVLKNILKLSDEDVSKLRRNMSNVGRKIAHALEKSGVHCGNLGIDMGIDMDGNIWIIEVNNLDPNHTIAIDAKNKQMFYNARLHNMLYARKLAGY